MKDYKIFVVDKKGQRTGLHKITATNNQDALAQARIMYGFSELFTVEVEVI